MTAPTNSADIVSAAEASPAILRGLLDQFNGFLLIKGMDGLEGEPDIQAGLDILLEFLNAYD